MMLAMRRAEALQFVQAHAAVFDAAGNPPNPFGTSDWMLHFVEQVVPADGTVLAAKVASDSGDSVMLLNLRGAGQGAALGNYYTSLAAPLASMAADRRQAAAALVTQIAAHRPRLARVDLAPLDADATDTAALATAFAAEGWAVRRYGCFANWSLPCAGLRWEAYLAGREPRLRNTLARKGRRFAQAGGRLRTVSEAAEVDAAVDAFEVVYARSWKPAEPYPGFVRGWARRCAARGTLRMGLAELDGEPVAAQFWWLHRGRASIFKLAHAEAHVRWSAGSLLTAHLMQQVLDVDQVDEVDYLTGDDPYKAAWMSVRRERVGLVACNLRSPLGAALAAREWVGALRQRWRTGGVA